MIAQIHKSVLGNIVLLIRHSRVVRYRVKPSFVSETALFLCASNLRIVINTISRKFVSLTPCKGCYCLLLRASVLLFLCLAMHDHALVTLRRNNPFQLSNFGCSYCVICVDLAFIIL